MKPTNAPIFKSFGYWKYAQSSLGQEATTKIWDSYSWMFKKRVRGLML